MIAIFRPDGRELFGRVSDTGDGLPGSLPKEFAAHVAPDSPLLRPAGETEVRTGLLLLSSQLVLFAAAPILRSDEKGPARGTVIFARYLDETLITRIEVLTGLRLKVFPAEAADLPADVRAARTELLAGRTTSIRAAGPDAISGYGLLIDYLGRPALIIRADSPRPIYAHGHLEGDELLKRTAEFLHGITRKQAIVTRFGGDEFAILLPETPRAKDAGRDRVESA